MISFLHPWVLAGLVAAGVPILLHLVARRQPPTVIFPAVRYLLDATRQHQRRLKLQNWLLLLLRTLLIIAVVLAAAGPSAPIRGLQTLGGAAAHASSALVLILDNSLSSGAVVAGTPRLMSMRGAAKAVLDRATAQDALWLITADGVPRRGSRALLGDLIDSLEVSPRRLDLGVALRVADGVLASESRPGEIVLVSDLQSSAVSSAELKAPLLVARPGDERPLNVGISQLSTGAQPWTADGGRVIVSLTGDSLGAVPVTASVGQQAKRSTVTPVGVPAALALPAGPSGWWTVTAELNPDELRADDVRLGVARVAPLARVGWDSADQYLAAAAAVLETNGRIRRGNEITLGRLGDRASIVQPPRDPAELGALNRALAQRGVGWSYGSLVTVPGATDSGALVGRERLNQRYALQPAGKGAASGVLATVSGEPWIVRGAETIVLGSRLEPEWTSLPLSAGFVPFVSALLNGAARGDIAILETAPGEPVLLPDVVTEIVRAEERIPVEGGAAYRPNTLGVYLLFAGPDTVGAIAVNPDPRESALEPASNGSLRRLWPGARIVGLREAGSFAFSQGVLGDLRGPLLWTALLVALAEVGLASAWRRSG